MLREWPSGDLFGLSQNAGMGWKPAEVDRDPYLILSTQGGSAHPTARRSRSGITPATGRSACSSRRRPRSCKALGVAPFAGMVSDPCDGRTQGTAGMMDSLPYRNDAAIVFRRLIRSLPRRKGVLGVATCDKGLPAMMLALAGTGHLPGVIVPGGVTLPPSVGEDAGKIQSIGARYSHGELTLARGGRARLPGLCQPRRRLPVPGHGGHRAGRGRGARAGAAARGADPFGPAALARHGATLGAGPGRTGRRGA